MKKALVVMMFGIVALGAAWVFGNRFTETAASAHGPGEDETSVALGKGKVTIHYGTPKLADRNLDEMTARSFRPESTRSSRAPTNRGIGPCLCRRRSSGRLSRTPSCSKRRCGLRKTARLRTCSRSRWRRPVMELRLWWHGALTDCRAPSKRLPEPILCRE
jgi:hypothetical protein